MVFLEKLPVSSFKINNLVGISTYYNTGCQDINEPISPSFLIRLNTISILSIAMMLRLF